MVGGVTLFGCLSGLAASFILGIQKERSTEMNAVLARLDKLDAKLDALNDHSTDRNELQRPRTEEEEVRK
jgi:hypothetical protein